MSPVIAGPSRADVDAAHSAAVGAATAALQATRDAQQAAAALSGVRRRVQTGDSSVSPADLTTAAADAEFRALAVDAAADTAKADDVTYRRLLAAHAVHRLDADGAPLRDRLAAAQDALAAAVRTVAEVSGQHAALTAEVQGQIVAAFPLSQPGQPLREDVDGVLPPGVQVDWSGPTVNGRPVATSGDDVAIRVGVALRRGMAFAGLRYDGPFLSRLGRAVLSGE